MTSSTPKPKAKKPKAARIASPSVSVPAEEASVTPTPPVSATAADTSLLALGLSWLGQRTGRTAARLFLGGLMVATIVFEIAGPGATGGGSLGPDVDLSGGAGAFWRDPGGLAALAGLVVLAGVFLSWALVPLFARDHSGKDRQEPGS